MEKQFALINIEKRKTISQLQHSSKHNNRVNFPENADQEKSEDNIYCGTDALKKHADILNKIHEAREQAGAKKIMKNAVQAVELTLGLSRETMLKMTKEERALWHFDQVSWAENYYRDRGTLIQADFHQDETNPHTHLVFIPNTIAHDKKTGQDLPTLSAKDFVGNATEMRRMRNEHAKHNAKYGVEPGGRETNPNYKPSYEYTKSIDDYRRETDAARKENEKLLEQLELYDQLPIDVFFKWFESIDFDRTLLTKQDYLAMMKEANEAKDSNNKPAMMKIASNRLKVQNLSI